MADDTNKLPDNCDQDHENCTCFNFLSINGSIECGCSLGYKLHNESDLFICQGEQIKLITKLVRVP